MPIAIVILLFVLVAIAIRQCGHFSMPIWVIMVFGGVAVVVCRGITLSAAWHAIAWPVIAYLLGVFVIAQALEQSGCLARWTTWLFTRVRHGLAALFFTVFILGFLSAFLMNDTVAIIGTPILLQLCHHHKALLKPLLLALAYAVTLGSVFSPIGNPQNLLIAMQGGIHAPFLTFIAYLFVPSLINLIIAYVWLRICFNGVLQARVDHLPQQAVTDSRTASLAKLAMLIMFVLITYDIIVSFIDIKLNLSIEWIAIIAALPILLFSPARVTIVKKTDWGTLLFFVAMFVLMKAVWRTDVFQHALSQSHLAVTALPVVSSLSLVFSQLVSNVPWVALYLPFLTQGGHLTTQMMALAAASTIAGNLLIFGAASNVIIIQTAEKRGFRALDFMSFARIGIPLTLVNALVFYGYLRLF